MADAKQGGRQATAAPDLSYAIELKGISKAFGPVQANRDITVGDVQVPRGTIVINLLRSDTLREDLVDQANEFRPERWLQAHNPAKRMSTLYGAGPRICPLEFDS